MSDIASLAQREGFHTVHGDAVEEIHRAAKGVVKRMVNNASKVATVCKVKTIKLDHLKVVENIQTGVQSGGRIILPAAYFEGAETEAYYPKEIVAPYETTASFVDISDMSRAEHAIKVLGGGSAHAALSSMALDEAFVQKTVKNEIKSGFTVDKDSRAHISGKVQNFTGLLVKTVRKQYPKQKILKGSMVKKILEKNLLA